MWVGGRVPVWLYILEEKWEEDGGKEEGKIGPFDGD